MSLQNIRQQWDLIQWQNLQELVCWKTLYWHWSAGKRYTGIRDGATMVTLGTQLTTKTGGASGTWVPHKLEWAWSIPFTVN